MSVANSDSLVDAKIAAGPSLDAERTVDPLVASVAGEGWIIAKRMREPSQVESFSTFLLRNAHELMRFRFAVWTFVLNTLQRRYRRSALGFAWSLISPLLTMSVMSIVFSFLFHRDMKAYAVFLFSGMLPWSFISDTMVKGSQSIVQSEIFVKKLFIPKLFFPLVTVLSEVVNFVLAFASLCIVCAIIGAGLHWTMIFLPAVIGITFVFCVGLALLLSITTVYFRDVTHILQVALTAIFYLIPIVYPISMVTPAFQRVIACNPFFYFIDLFRQVLYLGTVPTLLQWCIPTAIAVFTVLVALYVLRAREYDLVYRL